MAKTNRYASVNFNEIYGKKNPINATDRKPSSSPSSASPSTVDPLKTHLWTNRTHGGMLVLSRPSPKPHSQPQLSPPQPPPPPKQDSVQAPSEPDPICLRPLGRTGSSFSPSTSPLPVTPERGTEGTPPLPSPKSERFVPPHLRLGFVGHEERFVQDGQRQQGFRSHEFQGHQGSPSRYTEDGRPKSGGYERMRRGGGESDPAWMSRPSSSGNRPS